MKFSDKRLWAIIILGVPLVILIFLYYLRVENGFNLGLNNLLDNIFLLPLKEILENPWMVPIISAPFIVILASKMDKNKNKDQSNTEIDEAE
jgi:hypothetical protein